MNEEEGSSFIIDSDCAVSTHAWNDSSTSGGKAEAPSKNKAKTDVASCTKDYVKRRNQNNIAVRKSRQKSKQKDASTLENIEKLKEDNVHLERKVEVLSKELSILKKVFMEHAKGFSSGDAQLPDLNQLEELLGHKLTENVDEQPCSSESL